MEQLTTEIEKLSVAEQDHLAGFLLVQRMKRNQLVMPVMHQRRLPDPRGRMIEVKILGRQALLFFKDPFANIVKILEIRNVETA